MEPVFSSAEPLSAPERQLLLTAYQAFNARQIDAVLALMMPDVDWPNGMEGGYMQGHAAVRAYWERQWAMLVPHVEPTNLTKDSAGHLVVDVHQTVRDLLGNLLVDQHLQHVYQLEGGLIRRMEIREAA